MAMLGRLKQFDAYPKTLEDFRVKTWGGATSKACLPSLGSALRFYLLLLTFAFAVTLISVAVIVLLFLLELTYFLTTDVRSRCSVETS